MGDRGGRVSLSCLQQCMALWEWLRAAGLLKAEELIAQTFCGLFRGIFGIFHSARILTPDNSEDIGIIF